MRRSRLPLRQLPFAALALLVLWSALLGRAAAGEAPPPSPAPPLILQPPLPPAGAALLAAPANRPAPRLLKAPLSRRVWAPRPSAAGWAHVAGVLDRFMRRAVPESPLVGMGSVFVSAGRAAGVDPRFLVAVALWESRLGTTGSGPAARNAFGWGPGIHFASWADGIYTVARGLRRGYLDQGRTTIWTIASRWAPVGASNDATNMNERWAPRIAHVYAELGGNPAGSVTLGSGSAERST